MILKLHEVAIMQSRFWSLLYFSLNSSVFRKKESQFLCVVEKEEIIKEKSSKLVKYDFQVFDFFKCLYQVHGIEPNIQL